jgi:nitroreductase
VARARAAAYVSPVPAPEPAAAMDALEAILTRTTVPPARMAPPGPDDAQIRRILEAAASAPDHGRLRPWRFIVVRGSARERLGELLADAVRAKGPDVNPAEVEKQRTSPLRAPVLLVMAAKLRKNHPKIPEVEQLASAAAATQNALLAAHAMGFAAKWATGSAAYEPSLRAGLGLGPDDQVLGLIFLGSHAAGARQEPAPRPAIDDVMTEWTGEPPP